MENLAKTLADSPEFFPVAFDPRTGSVAFIRLGEPEYRRASFLDGRLLAARPAIQTFAWAEVASATLMAGLAERTDFIFHIGHVGSTLVSRLLGRHPAIFALREPEILRTIALMPPGGEREERIGVLLRLLSRTFDPRSRALIKATSFVSELAPNFLTRPSAPKALLMMAAPGSYLATILGAEHSPAEARALAPQRLSRINRRLGAEWRLDRMSLGEMVAMSWACETSALVAAVEAAPARALVVDFDRFLDDPAGLLLQAFGHLGAKASDAEVEAILAGPDMRTYSKAPEHAYDAALRRAVLDQAHAIAGDEIRRGLAWTERAAREHAAIAHALALFASPR